LESKSRPMSNWAGWDWIAYGCLGIAAFGVAIGAIWKENPAMFENWPLVLSSPKWSFVPMALFILGTGIFISRAIFVHPDQTPSRPVPNEIVRYEIPAPAKIPTSLRLQFNAGNMVPTALNQTNIWRWFTLTTIIRGVDQKGDTHEQRMLTIFVIFDAPISLKQIVLDAGGAALPVYEVKDSGPRHAIITLENAISGVVLEIRAVV